MIGQFLGASRGMIAARLSVLAAWCRLVALVGLASFALASQTQAAPIELVTQHQHGADGDLGVYQCNANLPPRTQMVSFPTPGSYDLSIKFDNYMGSSNELSVTLDSTRLIFVQNQSMVAGLVKHVASGTVSQAGSVPLDLYMCSNSSPYGWTEFSLLFTPDAPTATAIGTSVGPTSGGTSVTVTGSGFIAGNTSVTIGGTSIPANSVTVNSATSLTFTTPAHAAGNVAVTVTTSGGTTSNIPGGFTYLNAPTATSLSPTFGSYLGGASVTVFGSNFIAGQTSVTIGLVSVPAASVTVNSATSLTFVTPAHAEGSAPVNVTTPGGQSANVPGGFAYYGAPTASALSITVGHPSGGTLVSITGTNFVTGQTAVTIGGTFISPASVTVNSKTSLTFTTPANAVGNVSVNVTTAQGISSNVPGGFTYMYGPSASSLTPISGMTAGGLAVTVTGTGFVQGDTYVAIGGTVIPAGSVTVNSPTSLTFTTPAHAAGNVSVSVANAVATSGAISGGFTYIGSPTAIGLSPEAGTIDGGTSVTITGTNFIAGETIVMIGGNLVPSVSVTVNSSTSLTFSTPAHAAGTAGVVVMTSGGNSGNVPNGFIYAASPDVTWFDIDEGPTAGGTTVTLSGQRFLPGMTTVTIGGVLIPAGSVSVSSTTSLTFTTPAQAAGNVSVVVTTPGGTSPSVPGGFTYLSIPTASALSPAFGPDAGGTMVTVTGSGFVIGHTNVAVDGSFVSSGNVSVTSATSLRFIAPAHSAGNVMVSVSTAGGTSANIPGGFTYLGAPTATAMDPVADRTAGGELITLTGTNFVAGDTTVTIGGTVIPTGSVTVGSSTSLTFIAPAHAAGNVGVSVSTPGGTSGNVPGGFTYLSSPTISSISPTEGTTRGGTVVTVTGTNFADGLTSVIIGSTMFYPASVTVHSPTSLSVVTQARQDLTITASVTVITPGGSDYWSLVYTYVAPPFIHSISPAQGSAAGGTVVTITGSGFTNVTGIRFGSVYGSGSATSPTSITATTPPGTGVVDVVVVTATDSTTPDSNSVFSYQGAQTITFDNPGTQLIGTTPTLPATSTSGLTVSFTSSKAAVCTILSTGELTLLTPGTCTIEAVQAGDSSYLASTPVTQSFSVAHATVTVSPASGALPGGVVGTFYTQTLTTNGGTAPYSFTETSGSLPAGLSLVGGVISGTPTVAGDFNVTVTATEANGGAGAASYTIRIVDAPMPVTLSPDTGALPDGTVGTAYTQTLTPTGGAAPYGFAVTSGALPAGLSLVGGVISGTPTTAGDSTLTVTATEANGGTGTATYTISVAEVVVTIVLDPADGALETAVVGKAYTAEFAASGGVGAMSFALTAGALPDGLTLNPATGRVSGTPVAESAGDHAFTLTATDSDGNTASGNFTLKVAPVVKAANQSVVAVEGYEPALIDLTAGATGGPFDGATVVGVVPPQAGVATIIEMDPATARAAKASERHFFLKFVPSPGYVGTAEVKFTLHSAFGTSPVAVISYKIERDLALVRETFENLAKGFVDTRSALLAGSVKAPGLLDRRAMGSGSSPGSLTATPSGNDLTVGLSTSSLALGGWNQGAPLADQGVNFWIDATGTLHVRTEDGDDHWGSFALVSAGADVLVNDKLLVGLAVHGDWMEDLSDVSTATGRGVLVGPYISAEIGDGLFFDASLFYGRSWNDVATDDFAGEFETERLLAKASLQGLWQLSDELSLRPSANVFYLHEATEGFSVEDDTGNSVDIDGFSTDALRLSAGGTLSYVLVVGEEWTVVPYLDLQLGLAFANDASSGFATVGTGLTLSGQGAWSINLGTQADLQADGIRAISAKASLTGQF